MPKLSEHHRSQWSFFIGKGGKRSYNKLCMRCANRCKQSFRTKIIRCPMFQAKV